MMLILKIVLHAEELDQALQKFYVEVCNFVMPIINK